MSVAFGARLCCERVCGSENSDFGGGGDAVGFEGGGGALGLEIVYLVVILVCGMGVGRRILGDGGEGRTYGGRSCGYE